VKKRNIISQTVTLLLAAMLLMVAGVKSWSLQHDSLGAFSTEKSVIDGEKSKAPQGDQAQVSSLALDAVVTPAISFDFAHYFYFLSPAVWHFPAPELSAACASEDPFFPVSGFARIFGTYIVTNAP
jgi:hypothetical protein